MAQKEVQASSIRLEAARAQVRSIEAQLTVLRNEVASLRQEATACDAQALGMRDKHHQAKDRARKVDRIKRASQSAVSLAFLEDFYEEHVQKLDDKLTTGEVVERIIKPATESGPGGPCRYVDLDRVDERDVWSPGDDAGRGNNSARKFFFVSHGATLRAAHARWLQVLMNCESSKRCISLPRVEYGGELTLHAGRTSFSAFAHNLIRGRSRSV